MSVDLDELEARVRGREDSVIHLWGSVVLALIERAKQAEADAAQFKGPDLACHVCGASMGPVSFVLDGQPVHMKAICSDCATTRDLRHSLSVRSCHAQQDGYCSWDRCPQRRDGEPTATGRHCPLDNPANLDLEEWE